MPAVEHNDDLRPEDRQDRCVVCGSKVWPGESVVADTPVCSDECDERRTWEHSPFGGVEAGYDDAR